MMFCEKDRSLCGPAGLSLLSSVFFFTSKITAVRLAKVSLSAALSLSFSLPLFLSLSFSLSLSLSLSFSLSRSFSPSLSLFLCFSVSLFLSFSLFIPLYYLFIYIIIKLQQVKVFWLLYTLFEASYNLTPTCLNT